MTNLKNHPGYWLRDDAAKSFDAYEDKYGILNVTDAGRTEAQQQELINRWNQGGAANRPPNLYQPAMPASASNHVRDGGKAVDIGNYSVFAKHCQEFGFVQSFPGSDPVHFDFVGGGSGGSAVSNQVTKDRQNFLNQARGEKLVVDGVEGVATRDAYKRYQTFLKAYGYNDVVDGVWGANTQTAHAKYYAAWSSPTTPTAPPTSGRPSVSRGSTGQNVKDVQARLNRDYPLYSNLVVDGDFGAGTESVVREFQKRAGLIVDGVVGPATYAKLGL